MSPDLTLGVIETHTYIYINSGLIFIFIQIYLCVFPFYRRNPSKGSNTIVVFGGYIHNSCIRQSPYVLDAGGEKAVTVPITCNPTS